MSDVPAGEKWFGYPAMRGREFLRNMMTLRRWVKEEEDPGDDDDADAPADFNGGGQGPAR